MKKSSLTAFALVLGLALAFGTTEGKAKRFDSEYARLSDGSWILVTPETEEQYRCVTDINPCKATFPQDPNTDQSGMVITSPEGVYELR